MPRPVLAALVLPLVVIVGFQSAWAAYACTMDGKVRESPCCKQAAPGRERTSAVPMLEARNCCDVTIHAPAEAPVVRDAERAAFHYLPAVVAAPAFTIARPHHERVATVELSARGPPRVPIFLSKQALLR